VAAEVIENTAGNRLERLCAASKATRAPRWGRSGRQTASATQLVAFVRVRASGIVALANRLGAKLCWSRSPNSSRQGSRDCGSIRPRLAMLEEHSLVKRRALALKPSRHLKLMGGRWIAHVFTGCETTGCGSTPSQRQRSITGLAFPILYYGDTMNDVDIVVTPPDRPDNTAGEITPPRNPRTRLHPSSPRRGQPDAVHSAHSHARVRAR